MGRGVNFLKIVLFKRSCPTEAKYAFFNRTVLPSSLKLRVCPLAGSSGGKEGNFEK